MVLETLYIKKVFGGHSYNLKISSNKSMTGYLLRASWGVDAIAKALTIKNNIITSTINYYSSAPECNLNYLPNKSKKKVVDYVILNSFGF